VTDPVTFTEHVKDGTSTITCNACGADVGPRELAHIATAHPDTLPDLPAGDPTDREELP